MFSDCNNTYCNTTGSIALQVDGGDSTGSLPAYVYILMLAAVVFGTMLCSIIVSTVVASRKTCVNEEEDISDVNIAYNNDVDQTWIGDEAAKTAIRSKVVTTIFPTETVKFIDLYLDPEANTVEWVKKDGSCNKKDATCSICIEHFGEGDLVATSLCTHMFHHDCILGWSQIKSECPVCRQAMWESRYFDKLENEVVKQLLPEPACSASTTHKTMQNLRSMDRSVAR